MALQNTVNGIINTSCANLPFMSKSGGVSGVGPLMRIPNQQVQGIIRTGIQQLPTQVVIGRPAVSSGCFVVQSTMSSARGVGPPTFVNSNHAHVSSGNLVMQSSTSGNVMIRHPSSGNGVLLRPQLSLNNVTSRSPVAVYSNSMQSTVSSNGLIVQTPAPLGCVSSQSASSQCQSSTVSLTATNGSQSSAPSKSSG